MPTDPFVPAPLDERPRQEQNLPPGVHLPPARSWRATRPGDIAPGWPVGALLGSPGPNVGHAVKLVNEVADSMVIDEHEPRDAACMVTADLAMRRAAILGRAPVPADVEVARALLGYDQSADPAFATWRAGVVAHAGHDYPTRRAIIDAIPDEILRLDPADAPTRADEARALIRFAMHTV